MKTNFLKSFTRDLKKIKDTGLLERIAQTIEAVETTPSLADLPNLTKISGADDFFRIRVGDYRIGIHLDGDVVTFVRCLNRKDIYRYFP